MQGLAVAATLVVLGVLWAPHGGGPPLPPGVDKLIHGALFCAWAIPWRAAGRSPRWVLGAALVLALVSEVGQGLLPWPRTPELLDGVADLAGAVVGTGWGWRRDRRRRNGGDSNPR